MPGGRPLVSLVLAALLLLPLPMSTAAQVAGSTWTAPTYGFQVSWAGAGWELDPEGLLAGAGDERLDRLHLVNGVSSLYVEGATRYAGDLASCVAEEANILSGENGVSGVRPYRDASGVVLVADGPDASAAAFTLTLDAGGQQIELVDYIECRTLIPGEAVLIITLVTDPEAFAQEQIAARAVTDTISLATEIPLSPLAAYGAWLAQAQARPSIGGPLAGEIAFGPGQLGAERIGVDAPDFYTRAEFTNPETAESTPWDIGIGFRDSGGDEQYRLVVDSAGAWFLKDGLGPVIAQGMLVDLDRGPAKSNILEVVAVGGTGYFAFNERLVSDLDLSARTTGGDLFAGAGFFVEDAPADGEIAFSAFEVWSLAAPGDQPSAAPALRIDANRYASMISAATSVAPLAGPSSGDLAGAVGTATVAAAGIEVEDFVARATFRNPRDAADGGWDLGFAFREQANGDHLRITVAADGTWEYQVGLQAPLAGGVVPALNFAEGARNTIALFVAGDVAAFSVNGVYVSQLDASAVRGASDVWIGTGFHLAGATDGTVVPFEDFTVWPLDPAALPPPPPPDAPSATPIAATTPPLPAASELSRTSA